MGVKIRNFIVKYKFILAGLFLFFGMFIIVFFPSFSEKTSTSIWDGSIANKFSDGSGIQNDPYVINDGSELAYFFTLINGNNSSEYYNKYYVLNNNIDLDNIPFNYAKYGKSFNGTFDGNGYTIKNLLIDKAYSDENNNQYYSLFYQLNGGTIQNINFINSYIKIADNKYTIEIQNTDNTSKNDNSEYKSIENNDSNIITENNEEVESINSDDTKEDLNEDIVDENSSSENINENEAKIDNKEDVKTEDLYYDVKASLLTIASELSHVSNINVSNANVEVANSNDKIKSSILIVDDIENNHISNVNISLNSNYKNTAVLIDNYNDASIELILYYAQDLRLINNYEEDFENVYKYLVKNNKVYFDNKYPVKSILELLNNNSELSWTYDENGFRIVNNGSDPKKPVMKMMRLRSIPSAHNTGLDSSAKTVYINDYEKDKNYYGGLNYTYSSSNTIPTMNDKNIYGDNNLVYVQLNYHGSNITGTDIGYVSLDSQYSDFVYYKVYEVEDGYVTIDLIDNPYGDRPNDKVFYGWMTTYSNAVITLDTDVYIRRVKIPVTMSGGVPNNIVIDLYAVWGGANTVLAGTTSWSNIISDSALKATGFYSVLIPYEVYLEDMTNYYIRNSIRRYNPYPANAINSYGNALSGNCGASTCYFYLPCENSEYDSSITYYRLRNGSMSTYTPTPTQLTRNPYPTGSSASGLYRNVTIPRYASLNGYYNANGVLLSGSCNTSGGCSSYELIQYNDINNEMEVIEDGEDYYYFATRDTNIIVVNANRSNVNNDTWTSQSKPFTITSINNGTNYATANNASWYVRARTLTCYQDTRIEYIKLYSSTTKQNDDDGPSKTGAFVGNYYNTKIGRGIVLNGNYTTFSNAGGGNTSATGSSTNLTKYTFVVESGVYNNLSVTAPTTTDNTNNIYIKGYATYGSDFDRANNDNSKLEIRYCASGSWTGYIRAASGQDIAMYTTVKSGQFGSNKADYAAGIYIGGRNTGENYAARSGTIEGGYIYNLLGGPLSQDTNKAYNDTYMYIKGGSIDIIVGGAGRSTTYGNRIIQITGGQVNYAVFGGSNGVEGSNGEGTLDGDTYVYVGGNAIIGDQTLVTNGSTESESKVEAGSVFGIGNGKSGSTSIGTVNNSYVVIDGNATIRKNVYGGGNYGAAGQSGTSKTYATKIAIHEGANISGSVYGGGNNNGSGSTSNTDNITITMDGGTVNGSIYGGSRTLGRVYGSSSITVSAGTINHDVYGGGEGGYTSDTNYGTFVRDNVSVTIGSSSGGPTINGNVYGGSAYGTVNATDKAAEANNKTVDVVVNNGNIIGSVFGGAKGSSDYTPYVKGIINVTVNGGTIANVYGGFDMAGHPEKVIAGEYSTEPEIQTETYWVLASSSSDINTSGEYIIVNSDNNAAFTFNNNAYAKVNVNITEKGTTDNNVKYYNISGSNDNCVWKFDTNNRMYNAGDNSKYVRLSIYYTNNIVAVGSASSGISITSVGNNMWNIHRTTYYLAYSGTNFNVARSNSTGSLHIYKKIEVEITPEETDEPSEPDVPDDVPGNVHVYLNGGTIGNAFGGGNNTSIDVTDINLQGATVTNVYGGSNNSGNVIISNVNVTSGSTTKVFGGNNVGGTCVKANVNATGGTISTAVYGGGNEVFTTATNVTIGNTTNTIPDVYGGGNNVGDTEDAPGVNQTNVIINTGAKITNLFGGSNANGMVESSNITINDGTISTVYGGGNEADASYINLDVINGNITTAIYGGGNAADAKNIDIDITNGNINTLYGGGNNGNVLEKITVDIAAGTIAHDLYGGGNNGSVASTINLTTTGGTINGSVYGGGKGQTATVGGNIDVTMSSTTVGESIFGGGNAGAALANTSVDLTSVTATGNVYGGGNAADVEGAITVDMTSTSISGSVFGGGNEGESHSTVDVTIDTSSNIAHNVYGGGNAADVEGAIKVDILSSNISGSVFGGGNEGESHSTVKVSIGNSSDVIGTVYGGGNAALVEEAIEVKISSSEIHGDVIGGGNEGASNSTVNVIINESSTIDGTVYGGGNAADVTGAIDVKISSSEINGDVIGGGNNGESHSTVNVTINGSSDIDGTVYGGGNAADVTGAIDVRISSSDIHGNVIGGGNRGKSDSTVNVTINSSSSIDGDVYGGGDAADVDGSITVHISASDIGGNVFGGGNEGESHSIVNVTIDSSSDIDKTVYGGGNAADVTGKIILNIFSSSVGENIYGGGNEGESHNSVNVTINGSSIIGGTVFGGGNAADVTGAISVNISSSSVGEDIYGGGNNGNALNTTAVTINGNTNVLGDIYGGGNNGTVGSNSTTTINGGNVAGSLYGGGKGTTATVSGNSKITISSGTINHDVFGGGNNGIIGQDVEIKSTGGTILGDIYGGGNNAAVNGNTSVNLKNTTIDKNAYGGGNNGIVSGNASTIIENVSVNGSIYGGGNLATVEGDTNLTIGGSSIIGSSTCSKATECSVFGGGNKAEVGTSIDNNSIATVSIAGATIYGNVYGGCNTSRVFGQTTVNIGDDVITNAELTKGNILINGTVFGGGEANASGSEEYDYSYISVTNAIVININGRNYSNFNILGSIFGSGNASTSGGTSEISIKNYGTFSEPKRNVSIQRTGLLTIDNSSILLKGAKDRTNRFSDYLFSLSIIDELRLKNNSTLFLETGANLLKSFKSVTSTGIKASVTIDDENNTVTKNVDNRVYMLAGSQTNPLNIATNQDATTYGEVSGMTFFGMYVYGINDSINVGMYGKYDYGEQYQGGIINGGAYVLGGHKSNHNIKVDGFYSNEVDELTSLNTVYYIEPTPADSNFYRWIIGEEIKEINVDLKASKYSTLSTKEVLFTDYTEPNTTFEVIGFDYSELAEGVSLVNRPDVPRIAATEDAADSIMALSMEASDTGWLTSGSTYFVTNQPSPIIGTTTYVGENTSAAPSMILYIHHSKNIATSGNMGKVSVVLRIITKIDELTSKSERLVVNINLTRDFMTTDDYEAALTGGRKYSLFASTATNITAKSSLSAYYSLYKEGANVYRNGDHRALVSSFAFPENTKITMIDLSGNKYYYHVVSATEEQNAISELSIKGDIRYNLSMFEEMGAQNSGVYYNDALRNVDYYNTTTQATDEEFIFIVDFENANITQDKLENLILFEMLDANEETKISVIGEQHSKMMYNIYTGLDAELDLSGTISQTTIYNGDSFLLDIYSEYTQSVSASGTVVDTQYLDSKLGVKISLYNSNGELVSGASMLGLSYTIDGVNYSPNIDGTTRLKLADKVGNIEKWVRVNTGTSNLSTGNYKLVIENFASPDGIYYGLNTADRLEFNIKIVNEIYGLNVETEDEMTVIYGNVGKNLNDNERLVYDILYNSGLENPKINIKMYRRNYDEIYDTDFTLVDIQDYVTNPLFETENEKEYLVVNNPSDTNRLTLFMRNHLLNGTYKMEFILYDDNSPIGSVEKYIIIK